MASLTFTIPDESVERVLDGFCAHHAYQPVIMNPDYDPEDPESEQTIQNPVTQSAFLRSKITAYIRDAVRTHEQSAAMLAAKDSIEDVAGIE